MKNYYDVLEISNTAAPDEIKRAYFGLVRRYPPERFPEEFKTTREAYDILSDRQKRAEYDKINSLPEDVAEALRESEECQRIGKYTKATEILHTALKTHPGWDIIKARLAESLEMEGKTGTASKTWEELCTQYPANAEYALRLAESYEHLGWNKKAAAQYENALVIDSGNADIWKSYIDFLHGEPDDVKKVCRRAIDALRVTNREDVYVYGCVLFYLTDSNDDAPLATEYLYAMRRLAQSGMFSDVEAVDLALEGIMSSGNVMLFPLVEELANLLQKKPEELETRLNKARIYHDIETIPNLLPAIHDICCLNVEYCSCENCKYRIMAIECYILDNLTEYRPQLFCLKNEYPQLYELHAAFFDEALHTTNAKSLVAQRTKKLAYDDGNTRPARRESSKIGRNDPCPCGSGKKYKRCCAEAD